MLTKFILPMLTAASLLLGGCSTSTLNSEAETSSLKGVYDTKYYLQLVPVGDLDAYKFETCLVGSLDSCVGALKTNTGEDLLLTIKTLTELSLTEWEKIALLKNHEEYLAYQESLNRRGADIALAAGVSSGVVIGGGAVTIGAKEVTVEMADRAVRVAAEAREAKENVIRKAGEELGASEKITAHLADMSGLQAKVKADQSALQLLQKEKAVEVDKLERLLNELTKFRGGGVIKGKAVDNKTQLASEGKASIMKKLQAAGLSIDEAPKALITAGELGERTTLISDKFLKFVAEEDGAELSAEFYQDVVKSFGVKPNQLSSDLYKKWMSRGGKITEIFESEYFLTKIFEYNRIENALSGTAEAAGGVVRLAPENIDELAHAFEAGDFGFFKNSQEFVESLGHSPRAVGLYGQLGGVDEIMVFHYEETMESLITKAENRIANLDDQMKTLTKGIDQNLEKIVGNVDSIKGGVYALGSKKFQEATKLVEEADKLVRHTKWLRKLAPPAVMVVTAATVFGVGYVVAKDHVRAHADVQDVLAQHDELSTLVTYGSPLLSVEDTYNELVSSVETVLLNFAKWQVLLASSSSESSIVVEKICLPKVSSVEDGLTEADCHALAM